MSRNNNQKKEEIEMLYLGIGNKECVQKMHPVIAKIKDTISRKKYQILDDLRASSTSMSDESKSEKGDEEDSISENNEESSEIDDDSDGLESSSNERFSSFDSFCEMSSKRKEIKKAKKRERSRNKDKKKKKFNSLKPKEEQSKGEKKETIINHIKIINSQAVVQIRKEFFNK